MKSAGGALGACAMGICLLAASHTAGAPLRERDSGERTRVVTDGRLRPGHLEAIRVSGFPGKGSTEVSFFPTAICEDACSGRSFKGGTTDAKGAGTLRVHVPGTFFDHRKHPVYFRDGERVEVLVVWEGAGKRFDIATANPEPIIVRIHGPHHG